MDAAFIFLMFALKIPLAMLLYIVWYAIRAVPEPEDSSDSHDDGGIPRAPKPRHPRPPRPKRPRRDPHGDPAVPAPERTRSTIARGRPVQH